MGKRRKRNAHVIRTDIVAAVIPAKTSSMYSSRAWVRPDSFSRGTSSGTTACRKLRSWALLSTMFLVCWRRRKEEGFGEHNHVYHHGGGSSTLAERL
jgi:hypothetical protein